MSSTTLNILCFPFYNQPNTYCIEVTSFRTAMSDKVRVYVALYFLQGATKLPQYRAPGERPAFHWGINLQEKGEERFCAAVDVKLEDTSISEFGGWKRAYHPTADLTRSRSFIGMIMIGKVPEYMSIEEAIQFLEAIPVPRQNVSPAETCRTWTMEAISRLQQVKCAERFDIEKFVSHALRQGDKWYIANPKIQATGEINKANFTCRPM